MKILAVGGGSGGHVTPVVAVIDEIKKREPEAEIRFWCDSGFVQQTKDILGKNGVDVRVSTIPAGKFRRYAHLSKLKQLTMPSIVLPNILDMFKVMAGFLLALWRMLWWRPDVVFTKGGFVCLPVGWAARLLRIPLVIHDSDTKPGLTNRLLARHATAIATGAPLENYNYPADKSHFVGIPINAKFHPYDANEQRDIKQKLGFSPDKSLIVIVGGGLGAKSINDEALRYASELHKLGSVLLISGVVQYDELQGKLSESLKDFQIKSFVAEGMVDILGAADTVVSRAGATTMLELAALHKPVVIVPSSRLVWQVEYAKMFTDKHAAAYVDETKFGADGDTFMDEIRRILSDSDYAGELTQNIASMAMPNAARDMTDLLFTAAKNAKS